MTTNNLLTKIISMHGEPNPLSSSSKHDKTEIGKSDSSVTTPLKQGNVKQFLEQYSKTLSLPQGDVLRVEVQKIIPTVLNAMQALSEDNRRMSDELDALKARVQELEQNQKASFGQYEHHITLNQPILQQKG